MSTDNKLHSSVAASQLPKPTNDPEEVLIMLLEILRLAAAFGCVALIVIFWYWLMDSIGTF